MIRRPKAADYDGVGLVGAVGDGLDWIDRGTRDARSRSASLTRALLIILLLPAMLLPVLAWFQAELSALLAFFAVYGVVAIFGITFWAYCGRGPLAARLRAKRERLGEIEDVTQVRAELLSVEESRDP